MDWAGAIDRNRRELMPIVLSLFTLLGLEAGSTLGRMSRGLHRKVMRVLMPAESAVRRLIFIAARGLVVKPSLSRPMAKGRVIIKKGKDNKPSFKLFDPRKRFAQQRKIARPRITVIAYDPRILALPEWSRPVPKPPRDGLVDGDRIARRLIALKAALEDIPKQAQRLARASLRREKIPRLRFQQPMRPGRPPGYRRKPVHEIDHLLKECHGLAHDVQGPDTS